MKSLFSRQLQLGLLVLSCVLLLSSTEIRAQDDAPSVTRVEQYWVCEIDSPSVERGSPQLLSVISPNGGTDGVYAVFEFNQRSAAGATGGLQFQLFNGDSSLYTACYPETDHLNQPNERITFTVAMTLVDGSLHFQVNDGHSNSLGSFGNDSLLRASVATSLTGLDAYDSALSVAESGVSFGGQRVTRFYITEVRKYASDGSLISSNTTDRVVYPK